VGDDGKEEASRGREGSGGKKTPNAREGTEGRTHVRGGSLEGKGRQGGGGISAAEGKKNKIFNILGKGAGGRGFLLGVVGRESTYGGGERGAVCRKKANICPVPLRHGIGKCKRGHTIRERASRLEKFWEDELRVEHQFKAAKKSAFREVKKNFRGWVGKNYTSAKTSEKKRERWCVHTRKNRDRKRATGRKKKGEKTRGGPGSVG